MSIKEGPQIQGLMRNVRPIAASSIIILWIIYLWPHLICSTLPSKLHAPNWCFDRNCSHLKNKDKWHWISNTEWQCFLMEGTRRYLQNTVSSSTFTATALHIYICVGRCTLNDEISHWSRLFFSEMEINGKDLGVCLY